MWCDAEAGVLKTLKHFLPIGPAQPVRRRPQHISERPDLTVDVALVKDATTGAIPDDVFTKIAATIATYGCCLLRSALDTKTISIVAAAASRFYERVEAAQSCEPPEELFFDADYHYNALRRGICAHYLEAIDANASIFTALNRSIVPKVAERYLGSAPTYFWKKRSRLRKQYVDQNKDIAMLPFHQDCKGMGHEKPFMNCWIPLAAAAGRDCPGLEVLTQRLVEYTPHHYTVINHAVTDEGYLVEKYGDKCLWAPVLECGDVVLMDYYTLHRTSFTSAMRSHRISVDVRFLAGDDLPDYIDTGELQKTECVYQ